MRADDAEFITVLFAGIALGWFVLLLPTIIAFRNRHPHRWAILSANLFLGGTGIGWAGALAWAKSSADYSGDGAGKRDSGLRIFVEWPAPIWWPRFEVSASSVWS
ncbi:superinfection immunity protein [Methylobacterium sp. J-030]|uniref:superinfection immunity protein n=1 Tax=Methylobacterium sp. J-030 TaxID=2836627 RepID=UPI001FBAEA83|nr:superinfection immunity protein [Methylobacterium sp. J-030]MCJ2071067.1 superinfection immunity protein [Methylobacterium sp. J-030]